MNYMRSIIATLLVALTVTLGIVGALQAASLSDVNRMSGLNKAVGDARYGLELVNRQIGPEYGADFRRAWRAATRDAFNGPRMQRSVEASMRGSLSQRDLDSLAAFYGTPLGRKVRSAELSASRALLTANPQRAARLYAAVQRRDPQRAALYGRLLRATNAEANTRNTLEASISGLFAGISAAVDDRRFKRQLRTLERQYRATIRQEIAAGVRSGAAYTYQRLSMNELRAYVAFLETAPAKRYFRSATSAIKAVMAQESRAFGQKLFSAVAN